MDVAHKISFCEGCEAIREGGDSPVEDLETVEQGGQELVHDLQHRREARFRSKKFLLATLLLFLI